MAVLSHRVRSFLSLSTTLYLTSLLLTSRTIRSNLLHLFSPTSHPLRFLALITTILLNAKSLPLVWHLRLFIPMFYQLYHARAPLPRDALFRPIVTKGCRTSLAEADYNLHKSNSTYFADFDIARTMLVTCLLRKGIRAASTSKEAEVDIIDKQRRELDETTTSIGSTPGGPARRRRSMTERIRDGFTTASEVATAEMTMRTPHDTAERLPAPTPTPTPAAAHPAARPNDRFLIALGGVSTTFHRELKPYEKYDIWTRVLSWDRKWIYLVSHMVRAGAAPPDDFGIQARRHKQGRGSGRGRTAASGREGGVVSTAAAASESVLEALQRREQNPAWRAAVFASSISKYVVKRGRLTIPPDVVWSRSDLLPTAADDDAALDDDSAAAAPGLYAWTRENVERERKRGWDVLAGHFAELDKAGAEWPVVWGDDREVEAGTEGEEEEEEVSRQGATGKKKVNILGEFADLFTL